MVVGFSGHVGMELQPIASRRVPSRTGIRMERVCHTFMVWDFAIEYGIAPSKTL
jgi:hypothetical protein